MTTKEIHQLFDVYYDKANVITAYPSFLPEEKDVWLNGAYQMWVNQKFNGTNAMRVGFEGGTKRVADLEGLIKTKTLSNFTRNSFAYNELNFDLKDNGVTDYYLFVSAVIKFNNEKASSQEMIQINHIQANKFKKTSNNPDPWIPRAVFVEADGVFKVYYDRNIKYLYYTEDGESMGDRKPIGTVTSASIQLNYIKTLEKFDYLAKPDVEFELSDAAALEIVSLAVLLAVENIESDRMSTTGSLSQIRE